MFSDINDITNLGILEILVIFEIMSKQHLFLPILIYFSCNAVTTAQIIGGSIVDVPNLGAIRGKEIKTVGNLNYNQKTYHTFRNIPYAESVSGSKRFSVKSISHQKYVR